MAAKRVLSFLSIFIFIILLLTGVTKLGNASSPLDDITASIAGVVYQADGSTPIGNAEIQFNDYDTGEHIGTTMSDPVNGSYTMIGLAGGDYRISADAQGYGREYYLDGAAYHEATRVTLAEGEFRDGIDFSLDLAGIITGTVYDSSGTVPQPNIGVDTHDGGQGTCSDENGDFTLELAYGTYEIAAGWDFCGQAGYIEEYWQEAADWDGATSITLSAENPVVSPITFTLEIGGIITGTVTEESTGDPLEGASVCIRQAGSGDWWHACQDTDPDGVYAVSGLSSAQYYLQASKAGYATEYYDDEILHSNATSVTVTTGEVSPGIDFALGPGGTINGAVLDDLTEAPLEGIYVELLLYEGIREVYETGIDGNFNFEGVPYGIPFYVLAWSGPDDDTYLGEFWENASGFSDATTITLSTEYPAADPITFTLTLGGSITGTVTEEATGDPLAGANVCILPVDSGEWWHSCQDSDADGVYTIRGLGSGQYLVKADKDGYAFEYYDDGLIFSQTTSVTVTAGMVSPGINFELGPGGTVSGVVLDSGGDPIDEIYVELLLRDGIRDVVPGTGLDGIFTFQGIPFGIPLYLLAWSGPDGGPYLMEYWEEATGWSDASTITLSTETQAVSGITFTLDLAASITGTVYHSDGFTPIDGSCILASVTSPEMLVVGETQVAGGEFSLTQLPSGEVYLRTAADCTGLNPDLQDEWYTAEGSTPDASLAEAIVLVPGQTITSVVFTLDSAVSGAVSPEIGGTITSTADLTTTLEFPPDAVDETITVTFKLTTTTPNASGFEILGQRFSIEAFAADGAQVTTFAEPITITIQYSDADVAELDEDSLALYFWNVDEGAWEVIPSTADPEANTLTAAIDHLTDFAVFGGPHKVYLPLVKW